jgi:hypothetical protein
LVGLWGTVQSHSSAQQRTIESKGRERESADGSPLVCVRHLVDAENDATWVAYRNKQSYLILFNCAVMVSKLGSDSNALTVYYFKTCNAISFNSV